MVFHRRDVHFRCTFDRCKDELNGLDEFDEILIKLSWNSTNNTNIPLYVTMDHKTSHKGQFFGIIFGPRYNY